MTTTAKKKKGWEWIEFASDSYGLVSPDDLVYGSYKYVSLGVWELEIYRTVSPVAAKLPFKMELMVAKDAREYVETACLAV